MPGIGEAIENAAEFLARRQKRSGEIPVHRSREPELQRVERDAAAFGTAITSLALRECRHPVVEQIVARANRYIAAQRRDDGTWSYWPKDLRAPADADDTACCAMALGLADDARVAGRFEANRDTSGLFYTWFGQAANDVDSVVNANVLAYLGPCRADRVVEYLIDLVLFDRERGSYRYYLDPAALHYAIARAMRTVPGLRLCEQALVGKLRARLATPTGSILAVAQSFSALAMCGDAPDVDRLIEAQSPDGSWPVEAFYAGPEPDGSLSMWYGSAELSTVLCLEALVRS
jgi:hypothetical protein